MSVAAGAPLQGTLVPALAVGQLVAWGTLYYAFAILMAPMGAELGWSQPEMSGALSLGLAVTGLASYGVGRWIDRRGGRGVMTLGALLGAALLALWSQVDALWQLYAVWAGLGLAGAMTLYDPVFAVVARALPGGYRRAITTITLVGGLASTAFIPLTQALVEAVGWRGALLVLAAIELPLCAGVPWLLLHGREARRPPPARGVGAEGGIVRAVRRPAFWLLALSYVAFAFLTTAVLFNLVPMLGERGFTIAAAVGVYALIGPSQLVGRIAMLVAERWLTVSVAGLLGTMLPVGALLLLAAALPGSGLAAAFAVAFGAGMGIKTIVQATAAPAFVGRAGYGALQGAVIAPSYAAQAVAPFAAALLWQAGGSALLERALLIAAITAAAAFALAALMAAASRRRERASLAG
jgi:MFS family permease